MLTLCGFAVSNYHNKVKLALLEKGIAFDEQEVFPLGSPALMAKSPLGKIPYIETADGVLVESQVIVDYIEARYPQQPLIPADPFRAAQVRELLTFLELHIELVARELYAEAFFGGKVSDDVKQQVAAKLKKSIAALGARAKFAPYLAGDTFSMADCAAIFHFPAVSAATTKVLGEDLLAGLPVKQYLERMEQMPNVQTLKAAQVASFPAFVAAHTG
ncbi:MAG: glutathione S-transferase [Pseudomonadota bacterium]|nr:glutathione S-transferase [Pseudomonadota bacterium]